MPALSHLQIRQQAGTFNRIVASQNKYLKSKLLIKADNSTGLTISSDSAEVLLQLGHIKRGIQRFGVNLVIAERSSGEVGVRGVEAGRGDAAGYLQQSSEE